jgi:photosystem II stability/assembly factor-like uncharacterized protein
MSFGSIAVSAGDTDNIVWAPSLNRSPYFTKDRGVTWSRVVLKGERLPNTGSHAAYYLHRKTLASDRVENGVFYLVHSGGDMNPDLAGLWATRDGGANWEKVFSGEVAPYSQFSAKLRAVPGKAGHLFFTSGVAEAAETQLRRSIDGGRTWNDVPGVDDVDDIAFGKAAAGSAYPTIFISGQVRGRYGIWRSTDNAASWRMVGEFPIGSLDQAVVMEADKSVFGRVYIGYKGSGWVYGEPTACSPAPYELPAKSECFLVH